MVDERGTSGIRIGATPFMEGVVRVLIFGGTFDPPTRAHIELPRLALERSGADQLVFVPAGRSPHKKENPAASDVDRVAMLEAALADAGMGDVTGISTAEITSEYPDASSVRPVSHARPATYTIDTLRGFRSALPPGTIMRLLMGADQALAFHRWRDPGVIMALAEPMVMLRRPAESVDALVAGLREHWSKDEAEAWRRRVVELDVRDVSSTDVRELLRRGRTDASAHAAVRALLPDGVLAYIEERGLYRDDAPE